MVPERRGGLPLGKGMWIWEPQATEGGNAAAVVAKAKAYSLDDLFVRMGSTVDGFDNQGFLAQLLPLAHAAGIRVYGWDFPYLDDPAADAARAVAEITWRAPAGDRIDGFAADIEPAAGVNLSAATASAYARALRRAVGPDYPLVAVVPRPSDALATYPWSAVVSQFDAIAVMDYWLNRDPGADIAGAIAALAHFDKPVIPVGQAYDGALDGGPPGVPSPAALDRFMDVAQQSGAVGVSFWSWQAATPAEFAAIRDTSDFSLPDRAAPMTTGQVLAWQVMLSSLGFPAPESGVWDAQTRAAVIAYQRAAHLPPTGQVDAATRQAMLTPFPPPIHPER